MLPALFPYMVCCQLVAASPALARLGRPLTPAMRRLFRCPGAAAPLALLGMMGGSPSGARLIALQCAQGRHSRAQAERMACLTGTVSPMFVLSALPAWAGLPQCGWLLLGAHWAGALLVALCFARLIREEAAPPPASPAQPSGRSPQLGEVISASAQVMLTVGGCIVLGTVASALLARLLPFLPAETAAALHAVLEMAGGSAELAALGLPKRGLLAALAATISFGGLSILAQNLAFLAPAGVRALPVVLARTTHAALSAALVWFLAPGLPALPAYAAPQAAALSPAWGAALCAAPLGLWAVSRLLGAAPHQKSRRDCDSL